MGKIILNEKQQEALWHCYYPLITKNGYILYMFLLYNKNFTLPQVLKTLDFTKKQFVEAKEILEQCGLLESYYHHDENRYLLKVNGCLTIEAFLNHDVLGRYFLFKKGKNAYESLVHIVNHSQVQIPTEYENESKNLKNFLQEWKEKNEMVFQTTQKVERKSSFPINMFLDKMSILILPMEARSEKVIQLICEMADLYNISVDQMREYVGKSMDLPEQKLNASKLKYYCRKHVVLPNAKKKHKYDEYPKAFLQTKLDNNPITKWEDDLLYKLEHTYGLSNEVICVLIEYTIERCNGLFNVKYCESIAVNVSRKKIETYQEALKFLNNKVTKSNKAYENKQIIKPKQDDDMIVEDYGLSVEEIIALQKQKRGDQS